MKQRLTPWIHFLLLYHWIKSIKYSTEKYNTLLIILSLPSILQLHREQHTACALKTQTIINNSAAFCWFHSFCLIDYVSGEKNSRSLFRRLKSSWSTHCLCIRSKKQVVVEAAACSSHASCDWTLVPVRGKTSLKLLPLSEWRKPPPPPPPLPPSSTTAYFSLLARAATSSLS